MRKAIALSIAVLLSVSLVGCTGSTRPVPHEQNITLAPMRTETPSETEPPQQPDIPQVTPMLTPAPDPQRTVEITEFCSEEGTYCDYNGEVVPYSYHIPRIEDSTEEAAGINRCIQEAFGFMAENDLTIIANGEMPSIKAVRYRYYQNGDVLSLVVEAEYAYTSYIWYEVYNYNTRAGQRMDNRALLDTLGMDGEQFIAGMRRAVVQAYDDAMFEYLRPEEDFYALSIYQELRAQAVYCEHLTMNLPLYLNGEGQPEAIADISVPAGGESTLHILQPDFSGQDSLTTSFCDGAVTASLAEGQLTLRFTENETLTRLLEEWELVPPDYGTEISVSGAYSHYVGMNGCLVPDQLVLLLTTQEGRVEMVDILMGLRCGSFCLKGPLAQISNVDMCGAETDALYAFRIDGSRIELSQAIGQMASVCFNDLPGTWVYNRDSDSRFQYAALTIESADEVYYEPTSMGLSAALPGMLRYAGTTPEGMVYYYQFFDAANKTAYTGCAVLTVEYQEVSTLLHLLHLSGDGLFGEAVNEDVVLERSYG